MSLNKVAVDALLSTPALVLHWSLTLLWVANFAILLYLQLKKLNFKGSVWFPYFEHRLSPFFRQETLLDRGLSLSGTLSLQCCSGAPAARVLAAVVARAPVIQRAPSSTVNQNESGCAFSPKIKAHTSVQNKNTNSLKINKLTRGIYQIMILYKDSH